MTDFRPGDEGPIVPRRRAPREWPLLAVVGLVAIVAGIWVARPDLLQSAFGLAQSDGSAAAGKPDTRFAGLYRRYEMPPLGAGLAASPEVAAALAALQGEPCDKRLVFRASVALEKAIAVRSSAELMRGFGYACPDAYSELNRASELLFSLGDYREAARLSGEVIRRQPHALRPYYTRAKAEQALQHYPESLADYAAFLQLIPNLKVVPSEVFAGMSAAYQQAGRFCEAIVPLQTYAAIDPEMRDTPALRRQIDELATKGDCRARYATGKARIERRHAGVPAVRAEINGVAGTFLVDTGASLVAVSPAFAERARLSYVKTDRVQLETANGPTSAALATADAIELSGLSAAGVPAIVLDKVFATGIDGLLGMSFLSRFVIVMEDRQIRLAAKSLGAE